MTFLTVGISLPFDRLVRAMDEAVRKGLVNGQVFAQVGTGSYQPQCFQYVDFLSKREYDDCIREASAIVGHAGIGTIAAALDQGKPILVMPRLKRLGEAVNDHQLATATAFAEMRHVLTAFESDEVAQKMKELKGFVPRPRQVHSEEVGARIGRFLEQIRKARS